MFKLGKIPGTDGRYKTCCRQFTEKGAEQIAFGAAQIGGKGAFVGLPRNSAVRISPDSNGSSTASSSFCRFLREAVSKVAAVMVPSAVLMPINDGESKDFAPLCRLPPLPVRIQRSLAGTDGSVDVRLPCAYSDRRRKVQASQKTKRPPPQAIRPKAGLFWVFPG